MAKKIVLFGAGKIGEMIATLLSGSGDYEITAVDRDADNLDRLQRIPHVKTKIVDITDHGQLTGILKGKFAALSASPYQLTPVIARAAKEAGTHYFDLTEDVESTRIVKQLAEGAATAFLPQCGLAPGFISIVAHDIAKKFDRLHEVRMRVGALPKYPTNALKYNLTWSTDGLINEYCNSCEAIVDGEMREVPALEEIEAFSLDGIAYEAFNTSGGLGTLWETLSGKVNNLNYRTVRYPGHRDIVKMLIHDLRLGERRELLKNIFEHALPMTLQDVVLIFVTASGYQQGRFMQESYAQKVYSREIGGKVWSAIQITTASGICAMLDLLAEDKLPQKGFVRQEQADLGAFISNRFGKNYVFDGDSGSILSTLGKEQEPQLV